MIEEIEQMIDAINDKAYTDANTKFVDLLNQKLQQSLDQEKVNIASEMFGDEEVEVGEEEDELDPDASGEYEEEIDDALGEETVEDESEEIDEALRKTRGQMSISELEGKLKKLKDKLARVNKNPNVGIHNDPDKIKMQISKLQMQIRTRKAMGEK